MSESRCVLRITSADRNSARVSVRRQQFSVGRPIEFDELASRISAIEYVLGALGAEAVTGLRLFADRRRVAIDDVEALVTGELENPLTFLEVVGQTGEPNIGWVELKLFVSSTHHDAVRQLWSETEHRLPLLCTLRRAVSIAIELVLTP